MQLEKKLPGVIIVGKGGGGGGRKGGRSGAAGARESSTDIATKDFNWQRSTLAGREYKRVTVSVETLDKAWTELRVEAGGKDGIGDRYRDAKKFLSENSNVRMSEVTVRRNGTIIFNDGRHRFAVLRDSGRKEIDVLMRNSKDWKG